MSYWSVVVIIQTSGTINAVMVLTGKIKLLILKITLLIRVHMMICVMCTWVIGIKFYISWSFGKTLI